MENSTEKRIKSAIPIYLIGITWIAYAFLGSMHRWIDFVIAAVLSIAVYFIGNMIFKGTVVYVEKAPDTGDSDLDNLLNDIKDHKDKIESFRESILNEDIKEMIGSMVVSADSIYKYLMKEPALSGKVRQMKSYLMPTADKLLGQYYEFEQQPQKGVNIENAMLDIERILPTVVEAYRHILNDLYADRAIDISVEIEVLDQMLDRGQLKKYTEISGSEYKA